VTRPEISVRVLAPGAPGAPVVTFVHGLGDAWSSWKPVARELDPAWRLLALDLPWRAGADYRWRRLPPGRWLGDALEQLGCRPDVVVAHSYGANAALELLCAADPRTGDAAMLICPLFRVPGRPVTWRTFEQSRATFVENIREGVRSQISVRGSIVHPGVLDSMLDVAIDRIGPTGFLAVFEQYAQSAYLALGNVTQPVLVFAGGADPALSRAEATALAARIPHADICINDSYDHFCHIRHAREVAARITQLMATSTTKSQRENSHGNR
jgi:pimeloyl-ACP methyl ester carboxylesterase